MKTKVVATPLAPEEKSRLAENELIISQGVKAFVAVGLALLEIRDQRLYREGHKTFEDYCRKRWGFSRQRGLQLIEAAEVAEEMTTNGCQMEIENERQARALAMVPGHLRAEVVEAVRDSGLDLTEQNITKAVNALLDKKRQEAKEREAMGTPEKDDDEDEAAAEDDAEEAAEETPAEPAKRKNKRAETLQSAAKRFEKERMYLSRGLEHLRLALKDLSKTVEADFKTKKSREAALDMFAQAEQVIASNKALISLVEA